MNRSSLKLRVATADDLLAMREVMQLAIEESFRKLSLRRPKIAASHVMGLDTQLVEDGTYFIVEEGGRVAGCGGCGAGGARFMAAITARPAPAPPA